MIRGDEIRLIERLRFCEQGVEAELSSKMSLVNPLFNTLSGGLRRF
jgi:hypothetical protein